MTELMDHTIHEVVKGWRHPYLSGSFNNDFPLFVKACAFSHLKKVEAQFLFSHIMLTGEWEQARVWVAINNVEYADESQIPDDLKELVSIRPRWATQTDFTRWCEGNVPGFKRSTFWRRHALIDKYVEMGMEFAEAVRTVTGHGLWSASSRIQSIFEFRDDHAVIGYKQELAERLPTLADGSTDLEDVKKAAIEYAREKAAAVQMGAATAREVAQDVRREIHLTPKFRLLDSDNPDFPFMIEATHWVEDDYYGEGEEKKFYLRFITEDGEILNPLPKDLQNWVRVRVADRARHL